ncbi:MAG: Ger(x)C family spore germination protein [Oscillospiraceae bacterium]|nr:Ger(x)C family spore germination protein [Oscillospiraceae bacterium]
MKKQYKIISLFLIAVFFVLLMSSCEKAGTELSDLMIIQGIAIDYKDGAYTVTVEILNNEQSGSPSGESGSDNKTKIYTSTAATVSKALRSITAESGNLPLFAHNRVIILGEDTLDKDLLDVLDFFIRDYDSRPSQLLCVAKGDSAENVIRAKLLNDSVKCEILGNLLEESYKLSLCPKVRLIDAVNYLKEETSGLLIPAIIVEENGENQNFSLDGCAVIDRNNTFSKYISGNISKGVSFLNDTVEEGVIATEISDNKKATFLVLSSKTYYKIEETDNKLHYKLKVKVTCELDELEGTDEFNSGEETIQILKASVSKQITEEMENTFNNVKNETGVDVFRFGKRLRNSNNPLYQQCKGDWDNRFQNISLSVKIEVSLKSIGEETFQQP